ncbi:MAG: hypothetical protein CVT65_14565 [Actinobacteria bacterium HGW-Actinobacteria-5]|jgi:hypothetical protein|nr:MAG: hypothetical protein CVT65_14565 [Actinobacteria bacterium HGW-Actinobacteria-5]
MNDNKGAVPTAVTMGFGVVVFVATLVAWLYGESVHVPTTILWTVATPIVLALFVGHQLGTTADAARQAATQTNGTLEARVKAAVATALADRDAARTRQAQGDISAAPTTPVATAQDDELPPRADTSQS